MALKDDLTSAVRAVFKEDWAVRDGRVVPEPKDLQLKNDAVYFEKATVLYTDLDGSTNMVNSKKWEFSGEIYKTFLHCAAKLIRSFGGVVTAYDGDRVMGVFIGDDQATNAGIAALKINSAVSDIINPMIGDYWNGGFEIQHRTGIDQSPIHAARTGVRGDNDIVWIGRAANYAAKLSAVNKPSNVKSWATKAAYNAMGDSAKYSDGKSMWQQFDWTEHDNSKIYGSTWKWGV